jgi:hypothetical protein
MVHVLALTLKQFKVFKSWVAFIVVSVMDNFRIKQWSVKVLFHCKSVYSNRGFHSTSDYIYNRIAIMVKKYRTYVGKVRQSTQMGLDFFRQFHSLIIAHEVVGCQGGFNG